MAHVRGRGRTMQRTDVLEPYPVTPKISLDRPIPQMSAYHIGVVHCTCADTAASCSAFSFDSRLPSWLSTFTATVLPFHLAAPHHVSGYTFQVLGFGIRVARFQCLLF
jgi:hypothetical protein